MTTRTASGWAEYFVGVVGLSNDEAIAFLEQAINNDLIRVESQQLEVLEAIEAARNPAPEPEPVVVEIAEEPVIAPEPSEADLVGALESEIKGLYAQCFGFAALRRAASFEAGTPDLLDEMLRDAKRQDLRAKAELLAERYYGPEAAPLDPAEIEAERIVANASISFAGFVPGFEAEKMEALRIVETSAVSFAGFVPGALMAEAERIAALEAEKEVPVEDNGWPTEACNADYLFARYRKDELRTLCLGFELSGAGRKGELANRLAEFLGAEQNVSVAPRKSVLPELRGEVVEKGYHCRKCDGHFKAAVRPDVCPLCHEAPDVNVRQTNSATLGIPDLKGVPAGVADLVTAISDHGGEVIKVDERHIEFSGVTIKVHHPKKVWPARHSLQWPKWAGMELDVVAS